jgi:hypothetical protein
VAGATLFDFIFDFDFMRRCSYEYIRHTLCLLGVCVVDVS